MASVPGTRATIPRAAATENDHDQLRRAPHDRLAAVTSADGAGPEVWDLAAALLPLAAALPPVDVVDDLVALARMVVEGEPDADAVTRGYRPVCAGGVAAPA